MRRALVCLFVMLCASSTLQAQTINWIFQWNDTYNDPNDPNYPNLDYFDIQESWAEIYIYDAEPNEPFEFEARTQEWDPNSGQWNDIGDGSIVYIGDPNSGPPIGFTIVIDGQGAHTYGAENVKEISFDSYANLTIGRVEISGDLGDPNDPNAVIQADTITGPLLIYGNIADDIEIDSLEGDIECADMQDLTANGSMNNPSISIGGTYQGAMVIDGDIGPVELGALGADGRIDVLDIGTVDVGGDLDGVVDVASPTAFTVIYADGDCAGDGKRGAAVELSIEPYDTGGYRGDGFAGEVDHFVFDMLIEVADPNDDWTTAGAVVTAANGAAFRLAGKPTSIEPYATFVSPPRDPDADEERERDSGAEVIGAYLPPAGEYVFDAGAVNLDWFDLVESEDGPAAVMRLAIDVSQVDGADVSEGFGSVYFSQSGPASAGDIKVADFSSAVSTRSAGSAMSTLAGELFVRGG